MSELAPGKGDELGRAFRRACAARRAVSDAPMIFYVRPGELARGLASGEILQRGDGGGYISHGLEVRLYGV